MQLSLLIKELVGMKLNNMKLNKIEDFLWEYENTASTVRSL